jgi:small subunit ribosomal protein S19
MSRSKWKIPFIDNFLLKKISDVKKAEKGTKVIKTFSRSSVIDSQFIGLRLRVYNGKDFNPILITPEMLGHKLGEFVFTRARYEYKKKKKKK